MSKIITVIPIDIHAIGIYYRHTVIGRDVVFSFVFKVNLAMPFMGVSILTDLSPAVTVTVIPRAGEPSGLPIYS